MCGIIGYVGPGPAAPVLVNGLKRLECRGYDSAGLAVIQAGLLCVRKACVATESIDVLENLIRNDQTGTVGLGHTRWATHGIPAERNAHPHLDAANKIAVVHNGTIDNFRSLKSELEARGASFRSETDTEIIPLLLTFMRSRMPKASFIDVLRSTLNRLDGAYGLVVLNADEPDRLYAACRSAPLVIGVAEDATYVASEAMAFTRHTRTITHLEDNEIAVLTPGDFVIKGADLENVRRDTSQFEWTDEEAQKGGHPHFMRKEILEQAETLRDVMRGRLDVEHGTARLGGLQQVTDRLTTLERLIIVGCGTAYHAGLYGKRVIEQLARIPVEADLSHEFIYRDAFIGPCTAVIGVSQSGETAETRLAITEAKRKGALTLGIVNKAGTFIPRETDAGVYCHCGPEIGVASTKAFLAQATIFVLLALYLGRMRSLSLGEGRELLRSLEELPELAERTLKLDEQLYALAQSNVAQVGTMFLGRGAYVPIAFEGALKLNEIAYVHAHAHAAGEMKHGPLAIVEPGYPCLVLCPHDQLFEKNLKTISELQSRQARVIAITDDRRGTQLPEATEVLRIPTTHPLLQPLLSVIPLQLYAYHLSVARGINPDKPRNLAKSVTVE